MSEHFILPKESSLLKPTKVFQGLQANTSRRIRAWPNNKHISTIGYRCSCCSLFVFLCCCCCWLLLLLLLVVGCWSLVVAGPCSQFSSLFLWIGFRRFGRSGDIKTMHLKESYNLAINNTWEGIPWESKDRLFGQPFPVPDSFFSNGACSFNGPYTHEFNT